MANYEIMTDNTLRETTAHGTTDFPFEYTIDDIQKFNKQCIEWHWHNEFEFVTVDTGPVDCLVGSVRTRMYPGEGIFINSGIIHRFEAPACGTMPNILFVPNFIAPKNTLIYDKYIQPVMASQYSHIPLKQNVEWQNRILEILDCIYTEAHSPGRVMELQIHYLTGMLWSELFLSIGDTLESRDQERNVLLQARLQRMLQFIHDRYWEKVTLQDIARAANISKSEALRSFRSGVLTTPIDYLVKYRLNRAKELLITTGYSVSEIALAVGFDNVGYFGRIFKNTTDMTPKEFRRYHSKAPACQTQK